MNRAYSTFEIKSFGEEQRTFEGIASTPASDRTEDVMDPMGAKFTLPLAMKWQHGKGDIKDSIGWITHAKPSPEGIHVRGQIAKPKDDYPQTLKDQLNGCWVRVRDKLTRGLSIGFRPLEGVPIKGTYGTHYKRWDWFELSPVDIPMNAEASILTVKQYDETPRAERDSRPPPVKLGTSPPMSGTQRPTPKGNAMKTAAEQIKDLEASRAAKTARVLEVMGKSAEAGRSTDADEAEEADNLTNEIKAIGADLVRWGAAARFQAEQAKAIGPANFEQKQFYAPSVHVKTIRDEPDKFQGQSFTRLVIAKAMGDLTRRPPSQIAHERWGKTNPTLVEILKVGEVPGGGTGTGEWGAELAKSDSRYTGDFIEFLYGLTVFDKLPLTRIPANVFVKGQDGEGTAYWVGESKAIPVTTLDFMDVELRVLKVAAIAVVSNQLIRYSSPDAEMLIRNGLAQACAKRVDQTFLSSTAAVAGVSPAGILNGLTPVAPSGTDADAIRTDIAALYASFITARNATGLAIVTTPALAKSISMMVNPLGQPEFGGSVNGSGGTLLGDPVYVGDYVGAGDVILLSPKDIWRIGDTGLDVMTSREATIEQSAAPTGATDTPVAASQFITSMYQEDSTAVRIVRELNYQKRRSTAVAYTDAAAYAP